MRIRYAVCRKPISDSRLSPRCETSMRLEVTRALRWYQRAYDWVVAAAILTVLAAPLALADDSQIAAAAQAIKPDDLKRDVVTLAADSFEGRGAGYPGEYRAARYAAHEFAEAGLEPMGDATPAGRDFLQAFTLYPRRPIVAGTKLRSHNVLAFRAGADPDLRHEVVVIGAHHDGQGQLGEADPGRSPPTSGSPYHPIWNSADDNATGMATVLAIARALKRSSLPTRRSILFITFGAEEHGLVGSIYYVGHPAFAWRDHVAMLTFEQMGREAQLDPIVMGSGTSSAWDEVIAWANELTGQHVSVLTRELIQDTDHYGFGVRGVPALAMGIENSPDAHRPTDTSDKIDFASLAARARYAMAVLIWLANTPERPIFAGLPPCELSNLDSNLAERCSTARDPGLSAVTLTSSELRAARIPDVDAALKVVAVVSGLPAARAGLKAGDIITEINGRSLAANASPRLIHESLVQASTPSVRLRIRRGRGSRDVVVAAIPLTR